MYSSEIVAWCKEKWADKFPPQAQNPNNLKNLSLLYLETSWLNLKQPTTRHRMYCVINNISQDTIPKCYCGNLCPLDKTDHTKGFRQFCSYSCSRKKSSSYNTFLNDKDWLYQKRYVEKLSLDQISELLNCSGKPIDAALKKFDLKTGFDGRRKSKSSHEFLSNKAWLFQQYYTEDKSLQEIAQVLNVSKSTVQIHMEEFNYIPKNPNKYPRTFAKQSRAEREIGEYITSLSIEIKTNDRKILNGKELDILIPEYNFAIEYDGLYYHNDKSSYITPTSHLEKTLACRELDIFLLHIFEDEWILKPEIVKSVISSKLKKNARVFARKCQVKMLDVHTKDTFLNETHLQGTDRSNIKLGLYYEQELVACMTFCKPRFSKQADWELSRYSCKKFTTVVGGFTKLLKYAINNTMITGILISYSDNRYSNGGVYNTNGFKCIRVNKPSYYYIDFKLGTRLHRMNFQKKKFKDETGTEADIAKQKGYARIYDCGTTAWLLTI